MAEKYSCTIVHIEQNKKSWAYNGNTFYDHAITVRWENGGEETGTYSSKTPQCTAFQVGMKTEIERDVRVNGQFTNIKYKPVRAEGSGGGYSGGGNKGSYAKPGSAYPKNKAQEAREHLLELTKASLKISFDIIATVGLPAGVDLIDAIVAKTNELVNKLTKTTGADKLLAEIRAEAATATEATAATVVQPPAQQNNAPAAVHPTPSGGSPMGSNPAPTGGSPSFNATDDLPF